MAVLGILVQTTGGFPIYFSSWSDKIDILKKVDTELITGFFSAIFSFTESFHKRLGYIRLLETPMEIYGVDAICVEFGIYLFLCFVDSYQYHELVKYKINWIYEIVLKKYEDEISKGKVVKLTSEEIKLIEDILKDQSQKSVINSLKNQLNLSIDELISLGTDTQIYGISINSFDNTILYSFGIEFSSLELFINNLGQKGSLINEHEILYSYVSIPDFIPVLVVTVNPSIKYPIYDTINNKVIDTLPVYFNLIIDVKSEVRRTVELTLNKLIPLFQKIKKSD
ncbi:MAG: hypothetical protein ACTSRP_25255 [Candidatus Helarchaeota archaeon]